MAEGQPPLSGATGLFPNATAAAPAPSAVRNPYNTLPDGTQLSSLSAMVVELLLTGQQLYPFTAASQYDVASSVNGLLKSYPHLLELSNIGVRIRLYTPKHRCCLLPLVCRHCAKTAHADAHWAASCLCMRSNLYCALQSGRQMLMIPSFFADRRCDHS